MVTKKPDRNDIKQKVWDYARRNRKEFRVSDILMLVDISKQKLTRYLNLLEKEKYIVSIGEGSYKMAKVQVVAPTVKQKEPLYISIRRRVLSLQEQGNEIRVRNFLDITNRTTVKKELTSLRNKGVLRVLSFKSARAGYLYSADSEAIRELIEEGEVV